MANIPVKWYSPQMSGIPSLTAAIGDAILLLDAVLVDGFGLVTVDSIVVSSGVATITRSAGMPFLLRQVIEVAGATPSALNGQWRVTAVDLGAKTCTFSCPGVSDGTATGTITAKTPGLGWQRAFTGSGLRVYRSTHEDSPGSYYRVADVNDASNFCGTLRCYEAMTDVDTGTNSWYYEPSGYKPGIPRFHNTYGWSVVGDDRTVYLVGKSQGSYNSPWVITGFGDFVSIKPNDTMNEFAAPEFLPPTNLSSANNVRKNYWQCNATDNEQWQRWLHADCYGNRPAAVDAVRTHNDGCGYGGPTFPAVMDNGLMVTEHWIKEKSSGTPIRGRFRGAYWVLANQPFTFSASPQFISGVVGLEGRDCIIAAMNVYITSADAQGRVIFDATGPWT